MALDITFWILSIIAVVAALAVVLLRNLLRAALALILCFFVIGGIYATLNADFLAVAQVLVYVGAIAILIIFGIMLTRHLQQGNPFNRLWFVALPVAGLLLAAFVIAALETDWHVGTLRPEAATELPRLGESTVKGVGRFIFDKGNGFILVFEMAAALILSAVIGAIALVREK